MQTTGTDLKWAILGTLAITALIHLAAAKDTSAAAKDPWEELLTELEAMLSLAGA